MSGMLSLSQPQNEGYMMRVFVFRDACFSSPLVCGESNLLAGGLAANQGCAGSPHPLPLQVVRSLSTCVQPSVAPGLTQVHGKGE